MTLDKEEAEKGVYKYEHGPKHKVEPSSCFCV